MVHKRNSIKQHCKKMKKMKPEVPLEEYSSKNIKLEDGAYRWTYEMSMFTNPTIFFTLVRFFAVVAIIMWLFLAPIFAIKGSLDSLLGHTKMCGLIFLIMNALGLVSYLILAILYHGKYKVSFALDRNYLVHRQLKDQAEVGRKIGLIASIIGLLTKKPSVIVTGSVAASHNVSTSCLKNVTVIKPRRWRHTIHVNQLFNKNQIFVANEDFDFVLNFLRENCPKAKFR